MRTFGVEEELLLVNATTGVPVALADLVARPSADDDAAADAESGAAAALSGA